MKKHSHYHKDVSHLQTIDVYAVCDLFAVQDASGATQHAIKKLLCAGQRGVKSQRQDLQEAVDTLVRRIAMIDADAVSVSEKVLMAVANDVLERRPASAQKFCGKCGVGEPYPHHRSCPNRAGAAAE